IPSRRASRDWTARRGLGWVLRPDLLRRRSLGLAFLVGMDPRSALVLLLARGLGRCLGLRLRFRLGFTLGLRLALLLLRRLGSRGGGRLALDQLEHRHLGPVAQARSELDDAQIAALALAEARRDLVEHLLDEIALQHPAQHPPAVVHGAVLAARDHPLGDGPQLLGLGKRGDDLLLLHQRLELVAEQGLPVRGGPPQLSAFDRVTHDLPLLKPRPRAAPTLPCRGRDPACRGLPAPPRATSCRSSWSPACPSRTGALGRGACGCWRSSASWPSAPRDRARRCSWPAGRRARPAP